MISFHKMDFRKRIGVACLFVVILRELFSIGSFAVILKRSGPLKLDTWHKNNFDYDTSFRAPLLSKLAFPAVITK